MNQHRDYGDGGGRIPRESSKPGGRGRVFESSWDKIDRW